jgi:colicin import membrane protein
MKRKMLAIKVSAIVLTLFTLTANAQDKTGASKPAKKPQSSTQEHSYLNVESDSSGDPEKRITTYRNGSTYKIRVVNEKIIELSIDGKKIPEQDFPKYQSMVNKILTQVKLDEEQAKKDRAQAELDRQQADKDRARADIDRQQADRDREQAEKDRQQADLDRQQAMKDKQQAEKDRQQAGKDRLQAESDRAQAEIDRKQADEDRKLVQSLTSDLVSEKVVSSENDLYSVELSSDGLIVNDKKQSADLFQKLKAKYLKKPGTKISFSNSGTTRRLSVQEDK